MKGKKYLLTGLIFGMAMGWALGFLRLPDVEKNYSFVVGFLAALAFASFVLLLFSVWNRFFLPGLFGQKTESGNTQSARTYTFVWIILTVVLLMGAVVSGLTIYQRIGFLKQQIHNRDNHLREMAVLIEKLGKKDLAPLLRSILEDVGQEVKRHPDRMLSDTTIARIASLSAIAQPYPYSEADSLSENRYSPERGQLLQALVLMRIDTGSFARIKRTAHFAGADLRGADLKGVDLSGINLHGANLKDADLSGANLSEADLGGANLWGAKLNQAMMDKANLIRADLSWAQLNKASLPLASLDGATLTNAQLRKADLARAKVQWAQSDGALFIEANLTNVGFMGTNLTKANFSQANLSGADLRRINLSEANLAGVQLHKALVEVNWLEKAQKWQTGGLNELRKRYSIVNDTFDKWKVPMYRFRKVDGG